MTPEQQRQQGIDLAAAAVAIVRRKYVRVLAAAGEKGARSVAVARAKKDLDAAERALRAVRRRFAARKERAA